jgi:hypothetical protein
METAMPKLPPEFQPEQKVCTCGHVWDEHADELACVVEGCKCIHFDDEWQPIETAPYQEVVLVKNDIMSKPVRATARQDDDQ